MVLVSFVLLLFSFLDRVPSLFSEFFLLGVSIFRALFRHF